MTAYAIAHLRPADGPVEDEVLSYIERIQATMEPYGAASWCTGPRWRWWRGPGRARWSSSPSRHRGDPRLVRVPRLPGDPAAAHPAHRR